MTVNLKSKKGFTLVELSIVIALIAIIVMMISLFLPLLFKKSNEAMNRITVSEEMSLIETAVNKFVLHYDSEDYLFLYSDDGTKIETYERVTVINNEVPEYIPGDLRGSLWYDSEKNAIKLKDEKDSSWKMEQHLWNITNISFAESDSAEGVTVVEKAKLIGCNITYRLINNGPEYQIGLVFITHAQGEPVSRKVIEED